MKRSGSRDRIASSKAASSQTGLDVDFAKALRDFFQEMKDIQNGFKDMRDFGLYLFSFFSENYFVSDL
jgi:hypothetical protein